MNHLNSILVGVDFSECARSALEQAVRLAKWNSARLHVQHSIEHLTLNDAAWASHTPQEKLERDAVAEAKRSLQHWLRESNAPYEAEVLVDVGSPIDCVLRRVRETKADLLVLGVTGSSMIPMGAGTLATKCLRQAPTKVMLVHEGHTGPFRKVVAGVDFSGQSREAVAQALRVAAQDESQVHFLHVFTGSWGRYALVPDAWEVNEETAAQYRHALEQRLREFVGDTPGRSARFAVIEAANHGHGIAEYARRVGADLVVLGTKGRSNLGYVLLGSTVERLLREIPCSALVVRPPAGDGPMPERNADDASAGR
jgi:nucleotide-binding universal stress UspA family protein